MFKFFLYILLGSVCNHNKALTNKNLINPSFHKKTRWCIYFIPHFVTVVFPALHLKFQQRFPVMKEEVTVVKLWCIRVWVRNLAAQHPTSQSNCYPLLSHPSILPFLPRYPYPTSLHQPQPYPPLSALRPRPQACGGDWVEVAASMCVRLCVCGATLSLQPHWLTTGTWTGWWK